MPNPRKLVSSTAYIRIYSFPNWCVMRNKKHKEIFTKLLNTNRERRCRFGSSAKLASQDLCRVLMSDW